MSYDFKRTAKYALLAGATSYFGAAIIEKAVQSSPVISDDKYRMAGTVAIATVIADVAMQSGML